MHSTRIHKFRYKRDKKRIRRARANEPSNQPIDYSELMMDDAARASVGTTRKREDAIEPCGTPPLEKARRTINEVVSGTSVFDPPDPRHETADAPITKPDCDPHVRLMNLLWPPKSKARPIEAQV